jgi:gamma-glutamyl-gamma-aminobutyrate hydrolase PuuD
MKRLGITQRVEHIVAYGERRDCLDQRWTKLAFHLGCIPIPLPNTTPQNVARLLDHLNLDAVILSMQIINTKYGGRLSLVAGHVATTHELEVEEEFRDLMPTPVNSYHNWAIGPGDLSPEFAPIAFDADQNIEAFQHQSKKLAGIMWHPERENPFRSLDVELIKKFIL